MSWAKLADWADDDSSNPPPLMVPILLPTLYCLNEQESKFLLWILPAILALACACACAALLRLKLIIELSWSKEKLLWSAVIVMESSGYLPEMSID